MIRLTGLAMPRLHELDAVVRDEQVGLGMRERVVDHQLDVGTPAHAGAPSHRLHGVDADREPRFVRMVLGELQEELPVDVPIS